jgi:hypothetical protein
LGADRGDLSVGITGTSLALDPDALDPAEGHAKWLLCQVGFSSGDPQTLPFSTISKDLPIKALTIAG